MSVRLAYWLSGALIGLLLVASISGLVIPGLYRDPPISAAQARGTDLVTLAIAVPALCGAIALAGRGSLRATVVWLGVLGYIAHTYAVFAFTVFFNPLFLVYVAALSVSLSCLVLLIQQIPRDEVRSQLGSRLPARRISLYLVAVAGLFSLAWLRDIVPAIIGNTAPNSVIGTNLPTNPVHVLDLGIFLPLVTAAGILLRRGRPWGYLLTGMLLVKISVLGLSVVSAMAFQSLDHQEVAWSMAPIFLLVTGSGLWLLVRYLRALHSQEYCATVRRFSLQGNGFPRNRVNGPCP
jgi:hypothetical protein